MLEDRDPYESEGAFSVGAVAFVLAALVIVLSLLWSITH